MTDVWYIADQKGPGFTRNPAYAKKDKNGKPINEVEIYKAKKGKNEGQS